jgi:hypothetical protein
MPLMLRDIIRRMATTVPELDIAGELPGPLAERIDAMAEEPDVVIVGAEEAREGEVVAVMRRYCHLRVLGISADGARTTLYEMRPHQVEIGELGTDALLRIIGGVEES